MAIGARGDGWYRRMARWSGRRAAYRAVFGTPDGERVLADLAQTTRFTETPLVPGAPDETAVAIGQHDVVRHILRMIAMTDAELMRIVGEQTEKDEDDDGTQL